jgi:hypothetical protein
MAATAKETQPIGKIDQVHGPVVDIACEVFPPLHRGVVSRVDHETYTFEVHQKIRNPASNMALTLQNCKKHIFLFAEGITK